MRPKRFWRKFQFNLKFISSYNFTTFFHDLMLYKLKIWRKYFLDRYITFQLKLHKVFEPIMPKDWICFCYYYVHIVFVMEVGTHSYTLTLCSSSCSKSQKKVTFIFGGRHQKKTVFRKRIAQVSGHNESSFPVLSTAFVQDIFLDIDVLSRI